MSQYFPDDENGRVLNDMKKMGDNLSIPRDINFSILFDDESSAKDFCQEISSKEMSVKYKYIDDEYGSSWDVTVTKYMIPDYKSIDNLESELGNLADSFGGKNDGWGCFSQNEKN